MEPLIDKLAAFGLTRAESQLYLYLLEHPQESVWQIAKNLLLPRTSIYDHLQKLTEKGLIERSLKYKSQEYSAAPLDILQTSIDDTKNRVETLTDNLNYLKQVLPSNHSLSKQTDVRYYHGVQGLQQMMWNTLEAKRETVGYSVYGRVEIVGKKFMSRWVEAFKHKQLTDRVIINPTKRTLAIIKKNVKPGIHQQTLKDIRYLPESEVSISGDTTIYNSTFAVCWWLNEEIVGIEIDNPEFVRTQKTIFETLWLQAQPVSPLIDTPLQNLAS